MQTPGIFRRMPHGGPQLLGTWALVVTLPLDVYGTKEGG